MEAWLFFSSGMLGIAERWIDRAAVFRAMKAMNARAGVNILALWAPVARHGTRSYVNARLGLRTRYLGLVRVDEQRLLLAFDRAFVDNHLFDIAE